MFPPEPWSGRIPSLILDTKRVRRPRGLVLRPVEALGRRPCGPPLVVCEGEVEGRHKEGGDDGDFELGELGESALRYGEISGVTKLEGLNGDEGYGRILGLTLMPTADVSQIHLQFRGPVTYSTDASPSPNRYTHEKPSYPPPCPAHTFPDPTSADRYKPPGSSGYHQPDRPTPVSPPCPLILRKGIKRGSPAQTRRWE